MPTTQTPAAPATTPSESESESDSKVAFTIVPRATTQRQDTVQFLKDYLALAEKGEVTTVAIAALQPDHCVQYGFSETHRLPTLLGAVQLLQNLLIRETLKDVIRTGSPLPDDEPTT